MPLNNNYTVVVNVSWEGSLKLAPKHFHKKKITNCVEGYSLSCPTGLPTIFVYGSSGQPYVHDNLPMDSQWAAYSAELSPSSSLKMLT